MVGIITFHGSYNYGSVLQAYATQQAIKKLGYDSEIINFRMKSQKDYYALYQTKYGAMRFFRNLLLLPIHEKRKSRNNKFEQFMSEYYKLSGEAITDYDGLKGLSERYDLYLSGGDQIWSDLVPELINSTIDYTGVYFLDFTTQKKVAYASSVGEINYENLKKKKNLLESYDYITTREEYGSKMLSKILNRTIPVVLDPTFLLSHNEWKELESSHRIVKEKYIFLYTLQGMRPGIKWGRHLKKLGDKLHLKVICLSPFFPVITNGVSNLINIGPIEFLNLMDNAELIFTDSFHGTVFSLNMEKPFYSLTKSSSNDTRKTGIIKELGLDDRILTSYDDIDKITDYNLDYSLPSELLRQKREESYELLAYELSL